MSIDGLRREFADPGNEFRFAPFWFINHELTEEETRWQVREMNRQGVGGFIYHPRHGLLTEYMSEQFLDNCAAAIDEAKKLGMKAYLYDENNWPSGPADAQVFEGHPEFRMSGARVSDCFDLTPRDSGGRELQIDDELIAVVAVPLAGGRPEGFPESAVNLMEVVEDGILHWAPSRGEGDWRVYVISRLWHVGTFFGSYLDTLNPDAVARFIELTHEKYRQRFEEEFGATVDGIFTDEPTMSFNPPECIPWTARMPAEFGWRKSYDLLMALPALFDDVGPETTRVRCDFWDVATDVYVNAFFKQIYQWCDAVRLNLMGHVNREGEITYHCREQGHWFRGARYMHWGGCDYLRENTWPVGNEMYNVLAAGKFASSAGHLLGKRIVGSECFGLASQWAIDLRNLKWMSDFQFCLGINQLEPHAFYYSIQGFRKWECPPGEFYQSPFWPYYDTLADYVGRLSAVLRDGQHIADAAHLYPNASFWAEMDPFENEKTEELRRSFLRCGRLLMKVNADFDYVSEEMLQRADFDGGEIAVKYPDSDEVAERFRMLVMPACTTISRATADALQRFVDAGGRIIALGELPRKSIERGEDSHVREIMAGIFGEEYDLSMGLRDAEGPVVAGELAPGWRGGALIGYPFEAEDEDIIDHLAQALYAAIDPDVRLRDETGRFIEDVVHYHYAREGRHFVLLQNTSRETGYAFDVTLRMTGDVEVWDPEDGSIAPALVARGEPGHLHLPVRLEPAQCLLLCVDPRAQCPSTPVIAADLPLVSASGDEIVGLARQTGSYSVTIGSHQREPRVVRAAVRAMPNVVELEDEWEFETDSPNALPLSRWEYEMDYWVVNTDAAANEHIYRARFHSEIVPKETRLLLDGLATEKVWEGSTVVSFEVLVNGDRVGRSTGGRGNLAIEGMEPGHYLDHYIYEAPLDELIIEGPNVVEVRTRGQLYETPNLGHPIIIVGRFAVGEREGRPALRAEPDTIDSSGWDSHGYPYFSGIGIYRQKVKLTQAQRNCRLVLEMDPPGDMFEVLVNGRSCGVRAWEPWAVEITGAITGPTNDIEIRVANSLQNLLVQQPRPSGILGGVRIVPRKELRFKP
ncbi:MAG: glycosyl hydrolase [Armatimonadota bacterium]|nr:glycosyl hydrolase [Armatimonadota bacterium]